jgi:hypothetical protein
VLVNVVCSIGAHGSETIADGVRWCAIMKEWKEWKEYTSKVESNIYGGGYSITSVKWRERLRCRQQYQSGDDAGGGGGGGCDGGDQARDQEEEDYCSDTRR